MGKLAFFLHFEPNIPTLTHQNGIEPFTRKNGKAGIHKTKELEALEYFYMQKLSKFKPAKPILGAVLLETKWFFNGGDNCSSCTWRTKKPDSDNLVKTLKDCMSAVGFWKDDAQCQDITLKFDIPAKYKHGIFIQVSKIEDNICPPLPDYIIA